MTATGQTVIDLRRGGATLRAKTYKDYERTRIYDSHKQREDSIAYTDCITRGFNALHSDSLSQARRYLSRALQLRPDAPSNHIVRHQLGRIAMAEGKYAESIGEFTTILQTQPALFDVRLDRAACYVELQQPQQALDDCRTLFQHATDTATAVHILFLQSAAHRQLRQFPQVAEDIDHILRLSPGNTSALLLQAVNLESLGQPQEAINRMNLYVSAHPVDIEGLVARAQMLLRQHQPILAEDDVSTALRLYPEDASLYLLRAKIYDEMGNKRRAEQDRQRAREASVR